MEGIVHTGTRTRESFSIYFIIIIVVVIIDLVEGASYIFRQKEEAHGG